MSTQLGERGHRLWAASALPTLVVLGACVETRGTAWMSQPLSPDPAAMSASSSSAVVGPRKLTAEPRKAPQTPSTIAGGDPKPFKLTYYDFPAESDHAGAGPRAQVMSATCQPIADVPKSFHDTLCVQGSGKLARGQTVSFAKRDCACAAECPRTGARICFEALDPLKFPWGRGAAGTAIRPLRTVAADGDLLPLGTVVYIPVFDGLTLADGGVHDGCFVVQDRGSKVKGEHLDVFTGDKEGTARFREVVPKDGFADVIVGGDRCAHLARGVSP